MIEPTTTPDPNQQLCTHPKFHVDCHIDSLPGDIKLTVRRVTCDVCGVGFLFPQFGMSETMQVQIVPRSSAFVRL